MEAVFRFMVLTIMAAISDRITVCRGLSQDR